MSFRSVYLVARPQAQLENPSLRAFDAIHLAAALSIGDHAEAYTTYDARLAAPAATERLTDWQPGT